MRKPKIIDFYCCQGGMSMGYYQAGFEVVGVDINPQPRYPFSFIQTDAVQYLHQLIKTGEINEYDMVSASPPCQLYSVTKSLTNKEYPDLVGITREAFIATNLPYVIENVPGAPLINPLKLCGTMFGLKVIRHRLFECNPPIWFPPSACRCKDKNVFTHSGHGQHSAFRHGATHITVAGHNFCVADAKVAMDIDWMTGKGLAQAIPPAYAKFIGEQMIKMGAVNV